MTTLELTNDLDDHVKIDGVSVRMHAPIDTVIKNVDKNKRNIKVKDVSRLEEWRATRKAVIIGGGYSLKSKIKEIASLDSNNHYIFVCGSAHDYLRKNNIVFDYTIICDPDPIVIKYLATANQFTGKYLVSTQCHSSVFEYLLSRGCEVYKWNTANGDIDSKVFVEGDLLVGGGCTVGTRAIVLAQNFGYNDMHLYGFDNCIHENGSHAYPFVDPENEQLIGIQDIYIHGVKFKMADYMIGQLFDFRNLVQKLAYSVKFTIHGEGALYTLMEVAKRNAQNGKEI